MTALAPYFLVIFNLFRSSTSGLIRESLLYTSRALDGLKANGRDQAAVLFFKPNQPLALIYQALAAIKTIVFWQAIST